jgi:hypothetical protein
MSKYLLLLIITVPMVLMACNENELPGEEVIQLAVTDTLGSNIGDENYVFGSIECVRIDSEDRILVLDGTDCFIKVYSSSGEYLHSFGGSGSGPGEFLEPVSFAVLNNGNIAVADWDAWCIWLFNSSHEYIGEIGPLPNGAPLSLRAGIGGGIVGLGLSFADAGDEYDGEYNVSAWADSTVPYLEYLSGKVEITTGENGEITVSYPDVCFDTDSCGTVFAALSTDSTWCVEKISISGASEIFIRRDWRKVALSPEADAALDQLNAETGAETETAGRFAPGISGVYCDGLSRIWIRSGTSVHPFFYIYSEDGELLGTAECKELLDPLSELEFVFSENAILAWDTDPADYPKVYLLRNPFVRGANIYQ